MADSADATPETNEGSRSRGRRRSTRRTTEQTAPAATTGNTAEARPAAETTAPATPENGKGEASRKSAKKTTPRKSTRKTTRKTPPKAATRRTAAPAAPAQPDEAKVPASAVLAADFDRAQLTPKMRVHALAKLLGMTSKDVIAALATIGLTKVAQSTLSLAESGALLDALGKPAAEAPGSPDAEPVEKIRQRVEKNVANEIHQIEEKVERELADHTTEEPTAEAADPAAAPEESDADSFVASAEQSTPQNCWRMLSRRSLPRPPTSRLSSPRFSVLPRSATALKTPSPRQQRLIRPSR